MKKKLYNQAVYQVRKDLRKNRLTKRELYEVAVRYLAREESKKKIFQLIRQIKGV